MRSTAKILPLSALLLLSACTTIPSGPSVTVLPGTGKSFEQFRMDDDACRQYALDRINGVTPNQAANQSGVMSAVTGTVIGAAAGAALGGHEGAGVGAGTGLLVGSLIGSETAQDSGYSTQQRYNASYMQCMYASGHRVPVYGRIIRQPRAASYPPPPPPGMPPPPPPGVSPP
ncbi:proline-rich region [Sulfuriferula multivorans]|uniref:Proline-rich region n=1 Tax=Sulfuriferula multivorans TaxID=1559896 RepID=A0A401JAL8_9PROT|nr:glycine zipper family protein [Sulfuriferula multivorans]GBL44683.1 proline-rich region [Sulfuriferula multivorans]